MVAEGKVFAKDAESTVSAFDANTGERIWSVTLKPEKARDTNEFGGGVAYYGGRLFVTTGFADVFCLDPNDGHEIWNSTVSAPMRGAPLVFGDRVFSISIDNKLHAMAAVDGSDLWNFSGLQEVAGYVGGNSPAGASDVIVAPFSSGELVELRAENGRTGVERIAGRPAPRIARLRQPGRHSRPPGDRPRPGDRHGLGRHDRRDRPARRPAHLGAQCRRQPDAVGGRALHLRRHQQRRRRGARALHRQGEVGDAAHAVCRTRSAASRSSGPARCWRRDRLLIGGSTGELLALSPYTGEVTGKLELREPMRLAPVIANRTIYILADSGRLIALR